MRIKRTMGLALVVLGLGGLFACSSSALSPSSPHHLLAQDAQQVSPSYLAEPLARTLASSFNLKIDANGAQFAGSHDAGAGLSSVDAAYSAEVTTTFVSSPNTLYSRGIAGVAPDKFAAINIARLAPTSRFGGVADPLVALRILQGATDVFQSETDTYQGSVDINRIGGEANTVLTMRHISTLITAEDATVVPFTAKVSNGLVTSVTLIFPGADRERALTYTLAISDVGAAKKVSAPDSKSVVPAPADYYNGG